MTGARRDGVLQALVELGQARSAVDIARHMHNGQTHDLHDVVHHLWQLRREGLVAFDERRPRGDLTDRPTAGGMNGRIPTNIRVNVEAVAAYLVAKR